MVLFLNALARAWKASGYHTLDKVKWGAIKRVFYVINVITNHEYSFKIFDQDNNSFIKKTFDTRPEYYQIIESPYMDASWNLEKRINKLFEHLKFIESSNFNFKFDQSIEIVDLNIFGLPDYSIILDKPIWFYREGTLCLNLFKGNIRLYTVSFSIEQQDGKMAMLIGGIQGRNIENALDEYRIFTKLANGMRPRDFVIELTRIFAHAFRVASIEAVADECRHQRHRYFGKDPERPLPSDYNEIWADRGGIRKGLNRFILPMHTDRDITAVPAKKRSMYRKRYAMLYEIEKTIENNVVYLVPKQAIEAQ